MQHWFRRLLPREESFFTAHARRADSVVQGALALRGRLEGGEAVAQDYAAVLAAGDAADAITREVLQAVRQTFVTPFDRGDIQFLINRMDNSVDQMRTTAKSIVLFGMNDFDPEVRGMGDTILRCARLLRDAVPLLSDITPNAGQLNELCKQIRRVEGEADDIHDIGATKFFHRCQPDRTPHFIAARAVFDQLERTVDCFDAADNAIDGIVIEYI